MEAGVEATARRRVTAADVAKDAGVSRATVGYVLNGTPGQTISQPTRERVLASARRLGYQPNQTARTLASGRSRIVLFLMPDWPVEFRLRSFLDAVSAELGSAGYSLVAHSHVPGHGAPPLWESLNPDLVVSAVPIEPATLAAMRTSGARVLAPDTQAGIGVGGFDLSRGVSAGLEIQVGHLHERGHRRLVYAALSEPRLSSLVSARHRAAVAHARVLGLPEPPLVRLDYRDRSAGDAVHRWHAEGVTGVVAYNDDAAALVVGAAVRAGLQVPDDLAVVGHDDVPLASMFVPKLSSVRLDTEALGRRFAEAVLHHLDRRPLPDWIPVRPLLVRRETT